MIERIGQLFDANILDATRRALPVLAAVVAGLVLNIDWLGLRTLDLERALHHLSPWWGVAFLGVALVTLARWLVSQVGSLREAADLALEAVSRDLALLPGQLEGAVGSSESLRSLGDDDFDLVGEVRELGAHKRLHEAMGFLLVVLDERGRIVEANRALVDLVGESPLGLTTSEFVEAFTMPTLAPSVINLLAALPSDGLPFDMPLGPRVRDDDLTDPANRLCRPTTSWFLRVDPQTHRTYGIGYAHADH